MKISAVLFDMDGVIINTRKEIEAFWHHWAAKANVTLTESDIENYIHGCPPERTLLHLFPHISNAFKMEMETDSHRIGKNAKGIAMPGVFNFMTYLNEISIPFGIVTSHSMVSASRIVNDLDLQEKYRVLVTVDQVERGKPFPDPYLLAAEKLHLLPGEILVFEDSISGCTSALEAGMAVIGVNTPQNIPSLKTIGVEHVIENFTDVFEVLENLNPGFQLKSSL